MEPLQDAVPPAPSEREAYALLADAQHGKPEAVEELLAVWRAYLLHIANDELDTQLQPKVGASDIVQETLMLAHQHLGEFRGDTRQEMIAWLKRILLNRLADARRHFLETEKRQAGRELGLSDKGRETPIDFSAAIDSPSGSASANEEAERLDRALAVLGPDQREVIQLRNWERLSFVEIGERMNRTEEAARKLWSRAIERLQLELDAKGPT